MSPLPIRRLALVPLGFLLLGACKKEKIDKKPADLRGTWQLDKQTIKTTDAQGSSQELTEVLTGYRNHLEITDTAWAFTNTTGFREPYSYTRPTDSTVITRHNAGGQVVYRPYSLIELREHSLTTRLSYEVGAGGRTTIKSTYSR
ncbi:hypothetical protein LGH70_02330 [Hymenobacter sp. BT635]|uniref:Lipocalin-like domain-containing protein n=1 Tax=Hymenobacter nitidus TaxID=2880929 RepID=A0ABS8AB03_9BACT|nr:hypothetical protein [Hymenobacter nitidus]MCB2376400.1 hypothetical protein [Hymenobacter nitidus]